MRTTLPLAALSSAGSAAPIGAVTPRESKVIATPRLPSACATSAVKRAAVVMSVALLAPIISCTT